MNCRKCGRKLKNPKYIAIGIGPVCAKKEANDRSDNTKKSDMTFVPIGPDDDLFAEYLDPGKGTTSRVRTNIPLVLTRKSFDYTWGYGGSGPACLAQNILFEVTASPNVVDALYQDFKWEFIAPQNVTKISFSREFVLSWVAMKTAQMRPEADE